MVWHVYTCRMLKTVAEGFLCAVHHVQFGDVCLPVVLYHSWVVRSGWHDQSLVNLTKWDNNTHVWSSSYIIYTCTCMSFISSDRFNLCGRESPSLVRGVCGPWLMNSRHDGTTINSHIYTLSTIWTYGSRSFLFLGPEPKYIARLPSTTL